MAVRRPTSVDVAELAGVSRATVSHVLNGNGDRFPEATRARVRAAAEQLRYRPSPAGRALVSGRSSVVVLVIPNTTFGSNLQDVVDEVDRAARLSGLTLVVRFAGDDSAASISTLTDLSPAAVIDLAALSETDRQALDLAGIEVLPKQTEPQDDTFDIEIGRVAAEELLAEGPRRLVYASLADPRSDPFGPGRHEGVRQVAHEHALAPPVHIRVPLTATGAAEAVSAVMTGGPVGVVCYNDVVAIAVLAAARALRAEVPRAISIVGVDATEVGQLVHPRLTTIRIDLRSVVARLVQDVRGLRGFVPPPLEQVDEPMISVVRGETA